MGLRSEVRLLLNHLSAIGVKSLFTTAERAFAGQNSMAYSLRQRLLLSFIGIACLTGLIGLVQAIMLQRVRHSYEDISGHTAPALTSLMAIKSACTRIIMEANSVALCELAGTKLDDDDDDDELADFQEEEMDELEEAHEQFLKQLAILRRVEGGSTDKFFELEEFERDLLATAQGLTETGASKEQLSRMVQQLISMEEREEAIFEWLDEFIEEEMEEMHEAHGQMNYIVDLTAIASGAIVALTFIAAVIVGLHISRKVGTPISQLTWAVRRQSKDVSSIKVDLQGAYAEFRELGDAFNDMSSELGRTIQLEQARARADAANQAKSDFLANMSHEVRTPMTSILGYTDLMLEPGATEEERLDYAKTIRRNGNHLLQIINDILDLSKIDAGKMQVERVDCSPTQLLHEVESLLRVSAREKNLVFSIKVDGRIPSSIQSDPIRLRQILLNLVSNAIKFTDEGKVSLTASLDKSSDGKPLMRFDVADTGIGLTEDQQQNLFAAFTQADTSTTREYGGTGLGLYIARSLAQLLGGDLTVQSERGKGSTFTVAVDPGDLNNVPMVDNVRSVANAVEQVEEVRHAGVESVGRLDGARILIAEDGPDNQRLISYVLRKAGARIEVVENGKLAVERALAAKREGSSFDVILMDMQMPEMDGYAATAKLRSEDYHGTIVALTAHAMEGDADRCRRSGCNDYATKPVDRKKLIELVELYCRSRQTA